MIVKEHGITMNKEFEYSTYQVGKNKVPIYKEGNLFYTDYTSRLSKLSNGLIDHLFTFSDNTEKARKLHILANHLYILESENKTYKQEWSELRDKTTLLERKNKELEKRMSELREKMEGLREPLKKPIYTELLRMSELRIIE